jgi:3-hydroxybutyryl-CoA dehydrogenase
MTTQKPVIGIAGAGRMGRGIAIVFAFAGYPVRLIDMKERDDDEFYNLSSDIRKELFATLSLLASLGMLAQKNVESFAMRIEILPLSGLERSLPDARFIFEGVPETLDAKRRAFDLVSQYAHSDAIIASTTSTILSTDLQNFVTYPERFLNAHWLNPAYLVPLVELSPAEHTHQETTKTLKTLLENIGKVPVVCKASPGYIVPRIQALAMNEAARLYEEGIASAEDIDKATKYGLGFRFAILGMLEFIDWGGGDILYYASRYMTEATGQDRFSAPDIVKENMAKNRNGLRDRKGFLDYENIDLPTYQRERLEAFAAMLKHMDMLPKPADPERS